MNAASPIASCLALLFILSRFCTISSLPYIFLLHRNALVTISLYDELRVLYICVDPYSDVSCA